MYDNFVEGLMMEDKYESAYGTDLHVHLMRLLSFYS